jgi:hypothetical protein
MFAYAMKYIKVNKPDFVLTFGGMLFEQLLVSNLQKLKIKTCMYLVNENYLGSNDFLSNYDYVFTDSDATKNLYKKQRSDIFNIGKFISKNKVAQNIALDKQQYITMINPSPEKGVEIFIKLAETFKNNPKYQFLVVESRGKFEKVLPLYGKKFSDFKF